MPAEQSGHFRRIGFVEFDGPTSEGWRCAEEPQTLNCRELLNKQFCGHHVPRHLYEEVDEEFMYTITLI